MAAIDLFHERGIHATSPDDVLAASKTGKSQFYHYFKNKEGLVHDCLQLFLETIRNGKDHINHNPQSWQELESWFHTHLALQKSFGMKRGCPLGTIGNGLTEWDELARQDLSLIFEVIRTNISRFFHSEKLQKRLQPGCDPDALADFCIATIQGAMLMGKIKRDERVVERVIETALRHLRSFIVHTPSAA